MDIRELRYFVQIVRSGSFSAAAHRLNIAQPALSRQLKKLEDELGVQLLTRHGRGVELTEAGAILLVEAEALIDQVGEVLDRVRGERPTFVGQVTLGVAPTSGLLIVPDIFDRFRNLWPNATLIIKEGISSLMEEWLLQRRVDIAVLHNPTPIEGIALEPFLQERMVVAAAPSHPAAKGGPLRIVDLPNIPLVLPTLPHSNRRLLERVAIRHNVQLDIALEVDSIPLIKALVVRGFGATVQTFAGVALEVAKGELVARPIDKPPLVSTICIGMPRELKSEWLAVELSRLLRDCVSGLVARGEWAGAHLLDQPST